LFDRPKPTVGSSASGRRKIFSVLKLVYAHTVKLIGVLCNFFATILMGFPFYLKYISNNEWG
jgi:hypothetical protein